MKLVSGTRESELAMMQTTFVNKLLTNANPDLQIDVLPMTTKGDKILNVALSKIGEKSLFTKELEIALHQGDCHYVVHSLKDLPTTLPENMVIGAILEREDPRDAVVMKKSLSDKFKKLSDLPKGALIGSSSLRRQAQLKKKYPHLEIQSVRGNLNTRLKKLDGEVGDVDYSAIILATAGLNRMASQNEAFVDRLTSHLEMNECLYAVGQGALAVEILENDKDTARILQPLIHEETCLKVVAERAFMKYLDGGCSSPIAVNCTLEGGVLALVGAVFSVDGSDSLYKEMKVDLKLDSKSSDQSELRNSYTGILVQNISPVKMDLANKLGEDLAKSLMVDGAGDIIKVAKAANKPENNPGQAPTRESNRDEDPPRCPFPQAKDLTKAFLS